MAKRMASHSQPNYYPAKRLKVDVNKEEHPTTIFDLNEDCLTEVFCFLSQIDLVNVSETDRRLKYASERAFTRNFAKKQTIVQTVRDQQQNATELKNSLRLLQAFGHLMTKVLVMFRVENITKILESMIENCGENINELELCHVGVNIRKRALYNRGVKKMNLFLSELIRKYFNLRHLKLEYRNTSKLCPYFKTLLQHIPSLRSFSVSGASFPVEDVRQFIRLNGQLESLSLVGLPTDSWIFRSLHISQEFINDVDVALPRLKNVEFSCVYITQPYGNNQNRFQNVRKLSIGHFAKFTTFREDELTFAGINLEEICGYFNIIDHGHLRNFAENISQFKQLRRLDLHLMINNSIPTDAPTVINSILWNSLRIISNNNRLMEVVVQLFRKDLNTKCIAVLTGHEYYKTIESAFFSSQWNVIKEDSNRLVFTKDHET